MFTASKYAWPWGWVTLVVGLALWGSGTPPALTKPLPRPTPITVGSTWESLANGSANSRRPSQVSAHKAVTRYPVLSEEERRRSEAPVGSTASSIELPGKAATGQEVASPLGVAVQLPAPLACSQSKLIRVLLYKSRRAVCIKACQAKSAPLVQNSVSLAEGLYVDGKLVAGEYSIAPERKGRQVVAQGGGKQGALNVDGRTYRGNVRIIDDGSQLAVVNEIDLEDYLRGVVPRELLCSSLEAVKAQAVVARTYVLARSGASGQPWDVSDDAGSQVYGGAEDEYPLSDRAVTETAGIVLAYKGRLANQSLYHSTCGGRTENNHSVYGTPPVAYLQSVNCLLPDGSPACGRSSYAHWTASWSCQELAEQLGRLSHRQIKSIKSLEILETGPSGRVIRLAAHPDEGPALEYSYDEIRQALRYRDKRGNSAWLPSVRFTVDNAQPGRLSVSGSGWGHGVGMCQWGAIGFAGLGSNYGQILLYYFPGTTLATLEGINTRRWQAQR